MALDRCIIVSAPAILYRGCQNRPLQNNTGHHTAAFTLQTYAHVTEGMRRDSAAHMNSYIEKVMPKNAAETA